MLRKAQIFGGGLSRAYLSSMTFKQLAIDLMNQGWRCYHISDIPDVNYLHSLAIRSFLEVQVYEGKSLVFVRDIYPPKEEITNG